MLLTWAVCAQQVLILRQSPSDALHVLSLRTEHSVEVVNCTDMAHIPFMTILSIVFQDKPFDPSVEMESMESNWFYFSRIPLQPWPMLHLHLRCGLFVLIIIIIEYIPNPFGILRWFHSISLCTSHIRAPPKSIHTKLISFVLFFFQAIKKFKFSRNVQ